MTALKFIFAVALAFAIGAFAFAQAPPGANRNAAIAPNLRILSPKDGQKLSANYVTVQFQVTNRAAVANNVPTFNVSLDDGDPVQTATMSHTFTGLAPGQHTVAVQMVDANSLPVAGTLTQVHFVVAAPQNAPVGAAQPAPRARGISMEAQQAPPAQAGTASSSANAQDANLPSSSSALPLLSVIGFGVLVGGIASALKTR